MKAAYLPRPGGAEVLEIRDIEKPAPQANEVLVRIRVSTVTRGDVALRRIPRVIWPVLRVGMGLKRMHVLGHEFAGDVEAVGSAVTAFRSGDSVFGTITGLAFGSNAEYVCVPDDGPLALRPANATFDEAAALPTGAMTALWLLQKANTERGKSVLVYGASGSVGSAAVQLAAHFGAAVTAVCSTSNVDLAKSLGADRVVDYTRDDMADGAETYDIILDAVGKMPRHGQRALKPGGTRISVKTRTKARPEDLQFLRCLLELRAIVPVIDRRYSLDDIRDAHRYVEAGHKRGNVVIEVA